MRICENKTTINGKACHKKQYKMKMGKPDKNNKNKKWRNLFNKQ